MVFSLKENHIQWSTFWAAECSRNTSSFRPRPSWTNCWQILFHTKRVWSPWEWRHNYSSIQRWRCPPVSPFPSLVTSGAVKDKQGDYARWFPGKTDKRICGIHCGTINGHLEYKCEKGGISTIIQIWSVYTCPQILSTRNIIWAEKY